MTDTSRYILYVDQIQADIYYMWIRYKQIYIICGSDVCQLHVMSYKIDICVIQLLLPWPHCDSNRGDGDDGGGDSRCGGDCGDCGHGSGHGSGERKIRAVTLISHTYDSDHRYQCLVIAITGICVW